MKWIDQKLARLRIKLLLAVCRRLMPFNLWVGNHYGAYTTEYDVVFGRLDYRGVLQGVSTEEAETIMAGIKYVETSTSGRR